MVIFNGQQFTDEEFQKFQEEELEKQEKKFQEFVDSIKCGYAIIVGVDEVYCGLDRKQINPNMSCKKCISYKENVYEIIGK